MKKTLRISFNGKTFLVEAEVLGEDAPAPSRRSGARTSAAASTRVEPIAPVAATQSAPAAGAGDVPSPLAGKVVSIDAKEGTAVKAGQIVMTLEAMKMNTSVPAPADGTVASVKVAPGDSVEEGQILMTLK